MSTAHKDGQMFSFVLTAHEINSLSRQDIADIIYARLVNLERLAFEYLDKQEVSREQSA